MYEYFLLNVHLRIVSFSKLFWWRRITVLNLWFFTDIIELKIRCEKRMLRHDKSNEKLNRDSCYEKQHATGRIVPRFARETTPLLDRRQRSHMEGWITITSTLVGMYSDFPIWKQLEVVLRLQYFFPRFSFDHSIKYHSIKIIVLSIIHKCSLKNN